MANRCKTPIMPQEQVPEVELHLLPREQHPSVQQYAPAGFENSQSLVSLDTAEASLLAPQEALDSLADLEQSENLNESHKNWLLQESEPQPSVGKKLLYKAHSGLPVDPDRPSREQILASETVLQGVLFKKNLKDNNGKKRYLSKWCRFFVILKSFGVLVFYVDTADFDIEKPLGFMHLPGSSVSTSSYWNSPTIVVNRELSRLGGAVEIELRCLYDDEHPRWLRAISGSAVLAPFATLSLGQLGSTLNNSLYDSTRQQNAHEYARDESDAMNHDAHMHQSSSLTDFNQLGSIQEIDVPNTYTFEAVLGRGTYATVYRGSHVKTFERVAIKVVDAHTGDNVVESHRAELNLLASLRDCPFLTQIIGWGQGAGGILYMVMELCGHGSVRDLIENEPLDEAAAAAVTRYGLNALVFLHSRGIIHRDVKAGNLLVTIEGDVKLADLGVAGRTSRTLGGRGTLAGTPFWMAPEVIEQKVAYTVQADVWSLGITVIEMLEGRPPHSDQHPLRALMTIPRDPAPCLKESTVAARDFVSLCLIKEPSERATAACMLAHPFVQHGGRDDILRAVEIRGKFPKHYHN